mgnify:CR=1 FL=1
MILSVKEVADYLRVEHKTVRKLIDEGKLKAARVGRGLRVKESDIEAFLDQNTVTAKQ